MKREERHHQRPHSALCQLIPQMGSLRAQKDRTWAGLHNCPLGQCISQSCPFCLQNLHPLLSPSAHITYSPSYQCLQGCLPPSHSDFLPAPLQENKYFPTAAERRFENTPAKSLPSPYLPFSSFWPQPLHLLCPPSRMPFPQMFLGLAPPP